MGLVVILAFIIFCYNEQKFYKLRLQYSKEVELLNRTNRNEDKKYIEIGDKLYAAYNKSDKPKPIQLLQYQIHNFPSPLR